MTDKYEVRDTKGKVVGEIQKAYEYSGSRDASGLWELLLMTALSGIAMGLLTWGIIGLGLKIIAKGIGALTMHSNAFVLSGNLALFTGACASIYYAYRYLSDSSKRAKVLDHALISLGVLLIFVIFGLVARLIAWGLHY